MKKLLGWIIVLAVVAGVYFNREEITKFIAKNVMDIKEDTLEYKNSYYLKYKFNYVNSLDENDYKLDNLQDLKDFYYTIINNGNDEFNFLCPDSYSVCLNDVKFLADNSRELSTINGYVHPYNSFDTIKVRFDNIGRVKLIIERTYDDNTIKLINEKVEEIVKTQVKDEKDPRKIIRIIHDYIINNTKYDKDRADKNIITYQSNTAYGVLFEGYGICSGYADAMAIFLNYYDIPNFKVASENHVWNAVYLDDKWYHLDLTWDDPITNDKDILDHTYFLITTKELKEMKDDKHQFNEKVYSELALN